MTAPNLSRYTDFAQVDTLNPAHLDWRIASLTASIEVETRWLHASPARPTYYRRRLDRLTAALRAAQVEKSYREQEKQARDESKNKNEN